MAVPRRLRLAAILKPAAPEVAVMHSELILACRRVARSPGLAAAAVLTLGLGIGTSTAAWSVLSALVLAPLPVTEPERLVRIYEGRAGTDAVSNWSYLDAQDHRRRSSTLADLAVYADWLAVNAGGAGGEAELAPAALVTPNFFQVLGVAPALGRVFDGGEVIEGARPEAVLSHRFWRRRFAADPRAVGRTVEVNGHPFTVVGVAPASFHSLDASRSPDLWLPLGMWRQVNPAWAAGDELGDRGSAWLDVVGRMRPGAGLAAVAADHDAISRRLAAEYPETAEGQRALVFPADEARIHPSDRPVTRQRIALVLAAAALLLLTGCANLAGALLARAEARRKDWALRRALGASLGDVLRMSLIESAVLAVLGTAAGVLVASWLVEAAPALASAFLPVSLAGVDLAVGATALVFAAALGAVTALLVGLAPALAAHRFRPATELARRSAGAGSGPGLGARDLYLVAQMAASVLLLAAAGLLVDSFRRTSAVDLGFDPEGVLLASFDLGRQGYDDERARSFYREAAAGVGGLGAVEAAALAQVVPMTSFGSRTSFEVAGHEPPPGERFYTDLDFVTPGFVETLRIPLLAGRALEPGDRAGGAPVAVVNRTLAERFWPGTDAVGRTLETGGTAITIVGIVGDGKYRSVRESGVSMMYRPLDQSERPLRQVTLIARARTGEPDAIRAAVAGELRRLEPALALYRVGTLRDHVGSALELERIAAWLFSGFALVVLLVSAVGLTALTAHAVRRRTREIAIRLTVGAERGQVVALVVRRSVALVAAGAALGLGLSFGLEAPLADLLFETEPGEPGVVAAILAVLVAAALLAAWLPARAAARIEPAEALRQE
jgi:predicted permease